MLRHGTWKRAIFCHYCSAPPQSACVHPSSRCIFPSSFGASRAFFVPLRPLPRVSPPAPTRLSIGTLRDTRAHASTDTVALHAYISSLHHVALANYLSSCTVRVNDGKGCFDASGKDFFSAEGNIDKVNVAVSLARDN